MGPFHQARKSIKKKSKEGDKEAMGLIRSNPQICLETEECWAYSLLHHAARENRLDVVDTLVSNGSTLDSKDRYQQTPLWWACLWGRREVALRLLALGASLWTKANDGTTPYDHWKLKLGEPPVTSLPVEITGKSGCSSCITQPSFGACSSHDVSQDSSQPGLISKLNVQVQAQPPGLPTYWSTRLDDVKMILGPMDGSKRVTFSCSASKQMKRSRSCSALEGFNLEIQLPLTKRFSPGIIDF